MVITNVIIKDMKSSFDNFYRQFYRNTGFIPSKPLHQQVYPGDFFQVKYGGIMVLGNVFHKGIVDAGLTCFDMHANLYPPAWEISDGVSKPYSGRGTGAGAIQGEFEYSRQVIAFARRGSFLFRGANPKSVRIKNWHDLAAQLIIKLTQTLYSFRQVYLVTETATAEGCTLAIAGADNAELEIASAEDNFGLVDIFGKDGTRTIQSRDMEYFHRDAGRNPVFYKAKKLQVRTDTSPAIISDLLAERHLLDAWAGGFFNYAYDEQVIPATTSYRPCVLDLLQANELNPNTALQYFTWDDAGIEDIEKLFNGYDNG